MAKGATQLVSVGVVSMSHSHAGLIGCLNSDEVDVFWATNRPVVGASTRPGSYVVNAEMEATSLGWKVESESIKEAPCPFA